MKKALYFISWGIILPLVSLYLIFAFIMWDIWWPSQCDISTRVIFILLLIAISVLIVVAALEVIYGKEN